MFNEFDFNINMQRGANSPQSNRHRAFDQGDQAICWLASSLSGINSLDNAQEIYDEIVKFDENGERYVQFANDQNRYYVSDTDLSTFEGLQDFNPNHEFSDEAEAIEIAMAMKFLPKPATQGGFGGHSIHTTDYNTTLVQTTLNEDVTDGGNAGKLLTDLFFNDTALAPEDIRTHDPHVAFSETIDRQGFIDQLEGMINNFSPENPDDMVIIANTLTQDEHTNCQNGGYYPEGTPYVGNGGKLPPSHAVQIQPVYENGEMTAIKVIDTNLQDPDSQARLAQNPDMQTDANGSLYYTLSIDEAMNAFCEINAAMPEPSSDTGFSTGF